MAFIGVSSVAVGLPGKHASRPSASAPVVTLYGRQVLRLAYRAAVPFLYRHSDFQAGTSAYNPFRRWKWRSNDAPNAAAIDAPDGRGHKRGEIRSQEHDDVGDLFRCAEASERQLPQLHLMLHRFVRRHVVKPAHGFGEPAGLRPEWRPDRSGCDRIDPNLRAFRSSET